MRGVGPRERRGNRQGGLCGAARPLEAFSFAPSRIATRFALRLLRRVFESPQPPHIIHDTLRQKLAFQPLQRPADRLSLSYDNFWHGFGSVDGVRLWESPFILRAGRSDVNGALCRAHAAPSIASDLQQMWHPTHGGDLTPHFSSHSVQKSEILAQDVWRTPDEWIEWYKLTPLERWEETEKLWSQYMSMGGSLDPEPDSQSPFDFPELRGSRPIDGRSGLRVIRSGRI